MSQPIRYGLADADLGRIHPQADGHLVMWADYAALAAENERLRNAGDELLESFKQTESFMRTIRATDAWNAAKEGGAR